MRLGKVLTAQQNVKVALLGRKREKNVGALSLLQRRSISSNRRLLGRSARTTVNVPWHDTSYHELLWWARRKERLCPRYEVLRFPFAKCLVRKSPSTSTRAGRGPPGGVTRCTAPSACFQPFRITSTSPDATASPTIKSGRSAMPSPASNAGISASPLLTRSGPAGRTLACSPAALVNCQVPAEDI